MTFMAKCFRFCDFFNLQSGDLHGTGRGPRNISVQRPPNGNGREWQLTFYRGTKWIGSACLNEQATWKGIARMVRKYLHQGKLPAVTIK